MKSGLLSVLCFLGLSLFLPLENADASTPVRLKGVFESNGSVMFSLESLSSGRSAWVRMGKSFQGGRVVEYDREDQSIIFSNSAGMHRVSMFQASDSASRIVFKESPEFEYEQNQKGNLKPFSELPEKIKSIPPEALVEFLVREGYEVPQRVAVKARYDASVRTAAERLSLQQEGTIASRSEEGYTGPRAPTYTTSMTREEKIARRIIGYSN